MQSNSKTLYNIKWLFFYVAVLPFFLGLAFLGVKGFITIGVLIFAYFLVKKLIKYTYFRFRSYPFERKIINKFVKCFSIIDSNIWMDERYDAFFEALNHTLKKRKKYIELFGLQFDEMCNVKRRSDYNDYPGIGARLAISRVEKMQVDNTLKIGSISKNPKNRAYADPVIIKLITSQSKNGNKTVLVTNDKELRVRVRELGKKIGGRKIEILDMDKLTVESEKYCYYNKLNLTEMTDDSAQNIPGYQIDSPA